jgi:hypothetical protein
MENFFIIPCFCFVIIFLTRIIIILKYYNVLIVRKNIGLLDLLFRVFSIRNIHSEKQKLIMSILNFSFISIILIFIIAAVVFFAGLYTFPK